MQIRINERGPEGGGRWAAQVQSRMGEGASSGALGRRKEEQRRGHCLEGKRSGPAKG